MISHDGNNSASNGKSNIGPTRLKFRTLQRGDGTVYSMKCVQSEEEEDVKSDYRQKIEDTIQVSLWGTEASDGWEAVEDAAKWLDEFFSKDSDEGEDISDLKSMWTQISTGYMDTETNLKGMKERAYHRRNKYRKYYQDYEAKRGGEMSGESSSGTTTGKRSSAEIKANNMRVLEEYKQSNKERWEKDLASFEESLNKGQDSNGSATLSISTVPTIASTA